MSNLLRTSWSQVAEGYVQHFVPRFLPWIQHTINAFVTTLDTAPTDKTNPTGHRIFVAGCGPGVELPLLAERLPESHILAVDLAPGMVELARETVAQAGYSNRIETIEGDASIIPDDTIPLQGVFSCFTLQQMPDPAAVIAHWTRALEPSGVLAVAYWPRDMEIEGPWRHLIDITPPPAARDAKIGDWEANLVDAAIGEGGEIVQDTRVQYPMRWPNAKEFWHCMVEAGPWNSRLLKYGIDHMEELRVEFMKAYPDGGSQEEPLIHSPNARLLVIQKKGVSSAARL